MKRQLKKIAALFAAVIMILAMAVPAMADRAYDEADANRDGLTQGTGTTIKLHNYLVVDKDTKSPKITFSYTLSPGTAVEEGRTTLPVFAGPSGATVANVTFAEGAASTAGSSTAPITDTDKLYGEAAITLNFSSVKFDHPGVYRYVLEESASNVETIAGVRYDITKPGGTAKTRKRTIDIYVIDNNSALEVQGYVAYDDVVSEAPSKTYDPNGVATDGYANGDPNGSGISGKSNQFINQISTNTLKVTKVISGNQGDKTTSWNIKVDFDPDGVPIKYAKTKDNGAEVQTPAYADYTSGTGITFYHNDEYTFVGIPEGATYTVTETTDAAAKGYTVTYTDENNVKTNTGTFAADSATETKTNTVDNNRQGLVPTGLFLNYKPFWIMGGVALVLVIVFMSKRKNRLSDEI